MRAAVEPAEVTLPADAHARFALCVAQDDEVARRVGFRVEAPVRAGAVRADGIFCGQDRELGDDLMVDLDARGRVHVGWSDEAGQAWWAAAT